MGLVPDLRIIIGLRHQVFYWEGIFYKPGSNQLKQRGLLLQNMMIWWQALPQFYMMVSKHQ